MKTSTLSAILLGTIWTLGSAAQTSNSSTPLSHPATTARGCVVRESDGYYLMATGERLFLNWSPELAQSVNHMAVIEGNQEGQANNTYTGATGMNTVRSLHVTKVTRQPQGCGAPPLPSQQNPNSTYSTSAQK